MKFEKRKLGKKISSHYSVGQFSVGIFEHGISLKVYGQERVYMSWGTAQMLSMDLELTIRSRRGAKAI